MTFNTLRPRQTGHQLADVFKLIFLYENIILFWNFVGKDAINNKPALIQTGYMPLFERVTAWFIDVWFCDSNNISQIF